ncbi:GntR family transcriptional regulator [Desulfitobacterium sp.]|uniref:GntR family transcriptional regulator n=1 Tax=Desulfitobacterium sp. TaxID=49981 RepID=UPI002BFC61B0|nr:GntR family transcriptional regulator [Desulfitobacterium sp.]HVJ50791.1 GntR family transcriptional regulator [Desulfitobacterium sp.]
MELDRRSGIPYYIQLKEQIRKNLIQGIWLTGTKLFTERELAEQLGVSRNTVSQAYKELESEGILTSIQGRGTFVADSILITQQESRKEKILRIIDVAMEDAVSLGFTIDDFVAFAHVRGMEKKAFLAKMKVAFIECNPEQLAGACWDIGPGVTIIPVLLSELKERQGQERIKAMNMVVTGVNHLQEVKEALAGCERAILGISLQPKLDTMVRIAQLPVERDVALICESNLFAEKVRIALNGAGLFPKLMIRVKPQEEELQRLLPQCSATIIAPRMRKITEHCRPEQMELIEFRFEPDVGSINLLRSTLLELKSKNFSGEN